MAQFRKIQTLQKMLDTGLVPVFYHEHAETACQVIKACYDGGIRVFEFTNRGDFAHEVFADLIRYARHECPELILGIGSITDPGTASLYLQSGANFVVSPCFSPEVARICNRRLIPYIPGCGSVTEIANAQEAGCDICKVFPAGEVGGPAFVKNVKQPMPWSRLMATGAVEPTEDSLKSWMSSGVSCVGIGSKLFPEPVITSGKWTEITELCQTTLAIIQTYRTGG